MPGLLDFLFQGGQGGGVLGQPQPAGPQMPQDPQYGLMGLLGIPQNSAFGGLMGNLKGTLGQIADPDYIEKQKAQAAGMALLGALPGGQQQPAQTPSSPIGNYGNAIAGIESKGQANPYAAIGPDTGKGRAYGKYQVMDFNIPTWTKEVLGQSLTPQQFAASPDAQEAVFKAKFGQYVQQYGNPQDAASAWFTGKPLAQGANRSDVNGMTGQGYVDKFNAGLGPQAPVAPPPGPAPSAAPPGAGPQLGGNLPGSGLQLIDSPALQGMPATVRKALPVMLASKQYAPQAMAMIQKYLNPEQWQLYRDSMGNVFTRNSATGESKPLIQSTPQMMNANASGLPSPLAYENATALGQSAAKNTEVTGEQKNAAASGIRSPLDFSVAQEYGKVAAQNTGYTPDVKNYLYDRQPGESMAAYQARAEGLKSWAQPTGEQKNAMASGGLTPAQYETQQSQAKEAAQKRGEAEGVAQAGLTNAITQGDLALKTIDQIRNHPGKDSLFSVGSLGVVPGIPGTQQRGFVALVDQLKNKTFLQAYEALKGGGAITNIEGTKGENAIARLDRAQNPADFKAALDDLESVIKTGVQNARSKAAGISVPKNGGTTKSGVTWSVE